MSDQYKLEFGFGSFGSNMQTVRVFFFDTSAFHLHCHCVLSKELQACLCFLHRFPWLSITDMGFLCKFLRFKDGSVSLKISPFSPHRLVTGFFVVVI